MTGCLLAAAAAVSIGLLAVSAVIAGGRTRDW